MSIKIDLTMQIKTDPIVYDKYRYNRAEHLCKRLKRYKQMM